MCWLTIAAVTVGVVATTAGVVNAVNAAQQAEAQAAQAEYMQEQAQANAKLAAYEAEVLKIQGEAEQDSLYIDAMDNLAEVRATMGAAGVVLGQGTAATLEADVMDMYDLDKRNLQYNIDSQVYEKQYESAQYTDQANMYSAQASTYSQSATLSLIGGIASSTTSGTSSGLSTYSSLSKIFS